MYESGGSFVVRRSRRTQKIRKMPCGIPVAFPCIASSTYVIIEQSLQLDCHVVLETPETATAMRRPRVRRMRRRLGGARGGGGGDGGATRRTTTQDDAGRRTHHDAGRTQDALTQETAQYGGGSQKRHRQVEARKGVFCRYSVRKVVETRGSSNARKCFHEQHSQHIVGGWEHCAPPSEKELKELIIMKNGSVAGGVCADSWAL